MTDDTHAEIFRLFEQILILIAKDDDLNHRRFGSMVGTLRNPISFEDYKFTIENLDNKD